MPVVPQGLAVCRLACGKHWAPPRRCYSWTGEISTCKIYCPQIKGCRDTSVLLLLQKGWRRDARKKSRMHSAPSYLSYSKVMKSSFGQPRSRSIKAETV